MKKVYDVSKEDLKEMRSYTDRLMDFGLNSVELDPNDGHPTVTFDGCIGDILMALEQTKSFRINLMPRECPRYPTMCPKGETVINLNGMELDSIGKIHEMNKYLTEEARYCKSSGFEGCEQYRKKQLQKTNA